MPTRRTGHRRQDAVGQGLWGSPGSSPRTSERQGTSERRPSPGLGAGRQTAAAAHGSGLSCTRSSNAHTCCEGTHRPFAERLGFRGVVKGKFASSPGLGPATRCGRGLYGRAACPWAVGVPWEMPCHTPSPRDCAMLPTCTHTCAHAPFLGAGVAGGVEFPRLPKQEVGPLPSPSRQWGEASTVRP